MTVSPGTTSAVLALERLRFHSVEAASRCVRRNVDAVFSRAELRQEAVHAVDAHLGRDAVEVDVHETAIAMCMSTLRGRALPVAIAMARAGSWKAPRQARASGRTTPSSGRERHQRLIVEPAGNAAQRTRS